MSPNIGEWSFIEHMAVWPLTVLCLGILAGFVALVRHSGSSH